MTMPRSLLVGMLCLLASSCAKDAGALLTEVSGSRQANEILVRLIENGVHSARYSKEKSSRKPKWEIRVDPREEFPARRVLVHFGLPRALEDSGQGESSGFAPTAEQERMHTLRQMRKIVAASLEDLHGIVQARVHFFLPRQKGQYYPAAKAGSAKAAVTVHYIPQAGSSRAATELDGQPLRFGVEAAEAPAASEAPEGAARAAGENAPPTLAPSGPTGQAGQAAQAAQVAQVAQVFRMGCERISAAALRRWPVHPATIANIVASNLEDVRTQDVTVTFQDASQPLLNAPSFELVPREQLSEAGASANERSRLMGATVWIDERLREEPEELLEAYLEAARQDIQIQEKEEPALWALVPAVLMALLTLLFLTLWQLAERRSHKAKAPTAPVPAQAA
jgi:type III secretory pathway lipoprotein EscJ